MQVSSTTTADPLNMYNNINNIVLNPIVFAIILLVIIVYIIFFISLGNNGDSSLSTDNGEKAQKSFGFVIIGILIVLIIINALQYFFSINVTANLKNLFTPLPEIDITVDKPSAMEGRPLQRRKQSEAQVFNIPGNYYNYENAKALCSAYGSKLATYNQIEDVYKNGGEWCNYGWSEGQMALFPTQQSTFNNLQQIPKHEHDCGRPGINGGYIANPNVRFGVNCYGVKPNMTQEEENLMNTIPPYPETAEDIAFQKRVDFWKTEIDNILVSPFNHSSWDTSNNNQH